MSENEYYTSKGKKVLDFFIGFIGTIVIGYLIFNGFYSISTMSNMLDIALFLITPIALIAGAIYLMIKSRRRYIGIGIISALIAALVLVGGCFAFIFIAFSGLH